MRNYEAKDVDSYITIAAQESRPVMEELRKIIKSTVPKVEESISWGVPFYRYEGLLCGFSVFKKHITFGLAFVFEEEVRKALEEKGYATGKKTVQIKFEQKVPATIIKEMLKERAKINKNKKEIKNANK